MHLKALSDYNAAAQQIEKCMFFWWNVNVILIGIISNHIGDCTKRKSHFVNHWLNIFLNFRPILFSANDCLIFEKYQLQGTSSARFLDIVFNLLSNFVSTYFKKISDLVAKHKYFPTNIHIASVQSQFPSVLGTW